MEAELSMAVNQLASVPGSLGTVREALGRSGERRTCRGALKSIDTHTDRQTARTDKTRDLGRKGGHGSPFSGAAGDSPKPIFQMTEFSSWASLPPFLSGSPQ